MSNKPELLGYSTSETVNGGKLSPEIYFDGYKTPYPIKFAGLLLKTALSSAYDATATPTYPVAVPCGLGGRPVGFAYRTTRRTDQYGSQELFDDLDNYLPVVADRTGGSSEYAVSSAKFANASVRPLIPGQTIGVPVRAATNIIVGDEITSDASGFATVAVSGNVVVGLAESPANNAAGAAGAMFVRVKVGHLYTKA
jgi:hypothetical protein